MELQLECQQLRLHSSSELNCQVNVSAGAILEDCHHVHITGNVEVQDFDWLRSDVPSPNFTMDRVVVEPAAANSIPSQPRPEASTFNKEDDEKGEDADDDEHNVTLLVCSYSRCSYDRVNSGYCSTKS